jgi:hypothetical protein
MVRFLINSFFGMEKNMARYTRSSMRFAWGGEDADVLGKKARARPQASSHESDASEKVNSWPIEMLRSKLQQ